MGILDDAKDKARDMKEGAKDQLDKTDMDDKARAKFEKMRAEKAESENSMKDAA